MGTRATIRFTEEDETYYVYRGHDGFPENILPDIEATIKECKNRWSPGGELGAFVTIFLSMHSDWQKTRVPYYELTQSFHGDESYRYFCDWKSDKVTFGVLNK